MNRIVILTLLGLLLLSAAFVGVGFLIGPNPITPPPVTQKKPLPPPVQSGEVPQSAKTKEVVISAFMSSLPPGDTTKVTAASLAGDYGLLSWNDGVIGGQTLFKYNGTRAVWAEVTTIGGAFGVAELRELGIPQRTVLALLNGLKP